MKTKTIIASTLFYSITAFGADTNQLPEALTDTPIGCRAEKTNYGLCRNKKSQELAAIAYDIFSRLSNTERLPLASKSAALTIANTVKMAGFTANLPSDHHLCKMASNLQPSSFGYHENQNTADYLLDGITASWCFLLKLHESEGVYSDSLTKDIKTGITYVFDAFNQPKYQPNKQQEALKRKRKSDRKTLQQAKRLKKAARGSAKITGFFNQS